MSELKSNAAEYLSLMVNRPAQLQYAALCYRRAKKGVEVLLVTSRGTGRWIVPKGWAIKNLTDFGTAAREALEEAGVVGDIQAESIGSYQYQKWLQDDLSVKCSVQVYPLEVKHLEDDYPEKEERQRRWFSQEEAAEKVGEPELKRLLRDFTP